MPSSLEDGNHICIPCAEEELLRPSRARKKISKLKEASNKKISLIRNRRVYPITAVPEPLRITPKPKLSNYGGNTAIHLGHPNKRTIAACAYERYSSSVLTEDPSEVTCLNCLKIIGKPQDGRDKNK